MASRRLGFAALVPLLLMFMALVVSFACAFGFGGLSHHLHSYMHDFAAGPNASTIRVAHDTRPLLGGSKLWRFGDMVVMDDALTEGPGMGSRALGRAQGFYIAASSKGSDPTLHMSFHLLLTCGPYNGSTLAVTGRDNVLAPVRELSVVGGMGRFRMATGYVLMETVEWWHGQYALLELNVYVHA